MFAKIVKSSWFAVLGGLCQVSVGLGFLDIIGGWSNTGSIVEIGFGFIFLVSGLATLGQTVVSIDRTKRVQALVLVMLGVSVFLNCFLYSQAKQYYVELNQTRLDPVGLSAYPDTSQESSDRIRVVFFGDSRAASWKSPNLSGYEFINRGIGAQTSIQTIQRFAAHVRPLKPDIVVIQVGINDLKAIALFPKQRNAIVANCKANIKRIADESQKLGAVAIVTSIFPVGDIPLERKLLWSNAIEPAIQEVNAYIATLANEKTIAFDTFPILADSQGQMLQKYRENELHLNQQGYAALNQAIAKLLLSLKGASQ